MAHHGLYLMTHKAFIINGHDYDIMKEALIDDVSNMVKILEQTGQNNDNTSGDMTNDDGNMHIEEDECK